MKLSLPKLPTRKKLRATAARRITPREIEMEEPTMKLSSAFYVVLLLHVVAVGGIYAFNSIKANRPTPIEAAAPATTNPAAIVTAKPTTQTAPTAAVVSAAPAAPITPAASETAPAIVSAPTITVPAPKPTGALTAPVVTAAAAPAVVAKPESAPASSAKKAAAALPKDSGQVHVVAKGETPQRIARKLGVSYADLMKLNHIDNPNRLQIGQKLRIPAKVKVTAAN